MGNTGKKYVKLKGHEKPTKESSAEADRFMNWYGYNFEQLSKFYGPVFNDEVATDTALRIHEDISLRGRRIEGKYRHYYVRAYNVNLIAWRKKETARAARTAELDAPIGEDMTLADILPCKGTEDTLLYEIAVNTLRQEVLEFVDAFHSPYAASLFEIYVELSPDISYRRLADMLGLPRAEVGGAIYEVKRDVIEWFEGRRAYLLDPTKA